MEMRATFECDKLQGGSAIANHNDRSFLIENAENIDPTKTPENKVFVVLDKEDGSGRYLKALPQQQGQTVNLGSQTLTFYSGVPATQTQQYSQPVAYNYARNAGKCRVIDAYQESERLYQIINEKNKASGFDRFQAFMLILAFILVILLIAVVVIAAINPALITQFIGLFKKAAVIAPKVITKISFLA